MSARIMAPIVSPSGNVVVYEALYEEGIPRRVYSLDIATGRETLLLVDAAAEKTRLTERLPLPNYVVGLIPFLFAPPYLPHQVPLFAASIDDEGEKVLLLVRETAELPRQWLFLVGTDGSGSRWLGYAPEGYREAVLSGNGKVIFGVTEWGRLLRVDAQTEEVQELLPRTPWVGQLSGPVWDTPDFGAELNSRVPFAREVGSSWRGAANRILGGGFSTQTHEPTSFPAPTELGGVRVELAGQLMPLLKVSPSEIVYQIPWEFPVKVDTGVVPLRVFASAESPLGIPPLARAYGEQPRFEEPGPMHEDGEPLSLARPMQPGEIIRVSATGFDSPGATTGVPAPEPESPVAEGMSCRLKFSGSLNLYAPLELFFFNLAPGRIGLWEIRFRAPAEFPPPSREDPYGNEELICEDATGARSARVYVPLRFDLPND